MPERIKPTAWGDLAGYSAHVPDADPVKSDDRRNRANVAGAEVIDATDSPTPAHKHKNDPDRSSSDTKLARSVFDSDR